MQHRGRERERVDRCVKPRREANHAPLAVLERDRTKSILRRAVRAGTELRLNAAGSTDPDGHSLSYEWFVYPEPGTYRGAVTLAGANSATARVRIPDDAAGTTIHVIVAVRDDGAPRLARYRRVVIAAQ